MSLLEWLSPDRPTGRTAVKARLYLNAVLPALAEVWQMDSAVRTAAGKPSFSIGFSTLRAARQALAFDGERAWAWSTREAAQLELGFVTSGQVIATFEKRPTLPPLPLRGPQHLANAKAFERAAAVMESWLRPTSEVLEDTTMKARFAHLQLGVALRGVAVLCQFDAATRRSWQAGPRGLVDLTIPGVEEARWLDLGPGAPVAGMGPPPREPDATVAFASPQVAADAVRDQLDGMAAVNAGRIRLSGLVPLADHVNHLMESVGNILPR